MNKVIFFGVYFMESDIFELKGRSNLEKRLLNELRLLRYQFDLLLEESREVMSETEQISKLLERKHQPLLLGK